ncbi:cephalotocin receptor 2-like [Mytilus trossulus]|uniref:cephalotocin receptor 2-like n=1 Tax=Mytilus trossulus TaxID=6551 RepID=UPI0030073746
MENIVVEFYNNSLWDRMPVYNVTDTSPNNNTKLNQRDEELAKIEIAVQVAILTLAIFGNLCVLYALWRRKRKVTRMHIFIMHLCIADLLVAIFNILPQMVWDVTNKFQGGDFLCRFIKYMQVFVMYLSTYILVMTAIDRYRAICHPLSNHTWTPRLVKVMIGGAYFIAGVLSIPQFIIFKYQERANSGVVDCWVEFYPIWTLDLYVISFTVLVYIIPLIILSACYGSICYTIWKKYKLSEESGNYIQRNEDRRSSIQGNSSPSYSSKAVLTNNRRGTPSVNIILRSHSFRGFSKAKLKTVKLTFVIILAYITCWSPFFISQLWWLWNPAAPYTNDAVVIMLLLASLNSCCNPWIYLAFSGNMLSHLNPCKCKNNNVINSPYEGKLRHLCLCSCADSRTNGLSLNLNIQRESVTSTKSTVVTFSSEQNKFKSVAIPLKELN